MTHRARGRLIFSKEMNNEEARPIHNIFVRLFDDDGIFGKDDPMTVEGLYTDIEGRFEFKYDPKAAGTFDTPDLKLKVYERHPRYMKDGSVQYIEVEVTGYEPQVHNNVKLSDFDFGDIEIKFWEYAPIAESYTPRLYVNKEAGYPLMQEQHDARQKEETKKMVVAAGVLAQTTVFYPPLCKYKEEELKNPGSARSDAAFVDLALNGFNPCIPKKYKDGRLYIDFKYDGIMLDGKHWAPNTTAFFTQDKKTKELTVESIEIQERIGGFTRGHNACLGEPKVYKPADGSDWEKAKRVWRVNYFMFGELVTHLGGTHLNIEQYIVPLMRNVRRNPIFTLLFPHTYGTVSINNGADSLLTGGKAFVPLGSAVTIDSIAVAARESFSGMNWADWTPRKPINKNHYFADLQQEFSKVCDDHINEYFNVHEKEIIEFWEEIKLMSDELVKNGVPYGKQQEETFYDDGEINKATSEHPTVGHCKVAVSPITDDVKITADNKEKNFASLKQLCRYLLVLTTFKHSWVNDTQYDIGGWPEFATLGLDFDIFAEKNVNKDPVTSDIKLKHIVTTWFLRNQKWGYIIKNEARDMHPKLLELLEEKKDTFKEHKPIDDIRCCINT
eukprot:TRINITY_DN1_c0_g7_i1.p1 TRINITY_DN1_c0_g7~~TRINITY_DN1_c0_g7_i1.p1  ORF type:complete len:613 (+),score=213.25 TRINITY_DN1_c0_g7_i1:62-1900(+)